MKWYKNTMFVQCAQRTHNWLETFTFSDRFFGVMVIRIIIIEIRIDVLFIFIFARELQIISRIFIVINVVQVINRLSWRIPFGIQRFFFIWRISIGSIIRFSCGFPIVSQVVIQTSMRSFESLVWIFNIVIVNAKTSVRSSLSIVVFSLIRIVSIGPLLELKSHFQGQKISIKSAHHDS